MGILVLAHRAEIHCGTETERVISYFKNRKLDHEELMKLNNKLASFEETFPEIISFLQSLK